MPPENTSGYTPAPPAAPHRSWLRIVLAILVVIILIVLAYGAYLYWQSRGGATGTYFSLYENGKVNWYALKGNQVYPEPGPLGQGDRTPHVLESAAITKSGDTPVIAASGTGTQIGYFLSGGLFKSLVSDGNQKAMITDLPDGTIAYSELENGKWQLHTVSIFDSPIKVNDLGEGMAPVFTQDDHIIALAPDGIIRASIPGGQYPIVERDGISYGGGAIAPDASMALLPTGQGSVDLFSIRPATSETASYVGTVTATDTAAAFLSPTRFVLRNGNMFTFFTITGKTITQSGSAVVHQ